MIIVPDKNSIDTVSKAETEQVQLKKQEYYLLGSFLRTRGLRLYGYNHLKNEIFELEVQYGDTLHVVPVDGKLTLVDYEAEKCTVDSRFEYFEALNYKNALKRVEKYKTGKLDSLCNLMKPNPDGIKFW